MLEQRKEILTLKLKKDEEDEGTVMVSLFEKKEVGIAVSELNNGDAEIWLNLDKAKKVLAAFNDAIKEIEGSI